MLSVSSHSRSSCLSLRLMSRSDPRRRPRLIRLPRNRTSRPQSPYGLTCPVSNAAAFYLDVDIDRGDWTERIPFSASADARMHIWVIWHPGMRTTPCRCISVEFYGTCLLISNGPTHRPVCTPCTDSCQEPLWEGTFITARCNAGQKSSDSPLSVIKGDFFISKPTTLDVSLCYNGGNGRYGIKLDNVHGALTCRQYGVEAWLPRGDWSQSCGPTSYNSSTRTLIAFCTGGNAKDVVHNSITLSEAQLQAGVRNFWGRLRVAGN